MDVDLLFRETYRSGSIDNVIRHFLDFGFVPSAKHPFQLMRVQKIKGKDFIFNIDLLHPEMLKEASIGMFVDHLDLDVPLTSEETESKKMKSVVLPNSEVLFLRGMFSTEEIDGTSFNLVTYNGMFATKMDSCQKQKRERDAFDIYLGFLGNAIDVAEIRSIAAADHRIAVSLGNFTNYLKTKGSEFDKNVEHFARVTSSSPSQTILRQLSDESL